MVATVNSHSGAQWTNWVRLYNLTFLVGLAMSFFVFWALCYIFPPVGLGEQSPFYGEETLYGFPKPGDKNESAVQEGEKNAVVASVV